MSTSDPLADYSQAEIREAVTAIYSPDSGPETSIGSDGLVHYEVGSGVGAPLDWDAGETPAWESGEAFHLDASNALLDAINVDEDAGEVDRSTDAIRLSDSFSHVANRAASMVIPTTRTLRSTGPASWEPLPEDALTATEAVATWLSNNAGRSESEQTTPADSVDPFEPDPAGEGNQTGSGIPTDADSWRDVTEDMVPTPGESESGSYSGPLAGLGTGAFAVVALVVASIAAVLLGGGD
ncbi:hypothetical protein LPA44_04095 [Halobacterium sp. KA-4]|uniref:hypothetical protein n=1 Tax=Halobacterium sp. KA-4 TaxID=2896367 RepID=UPI001E59B164|nr:hypothetical protein [Halobacterium sp. KA-4]MCD2199080.1 hypothetical protein [Halobacterium sp. KA-4]